MTPQSLRAALEEVALTTENLQGLPVDLATIRHDLSSEVRRYLVPRLSDAETNLHVALTGPSGVGKSALANDLVGQHVSDEGALRPTTTTPVILTGVARDDPGPGAASSVLGSGSSLRRPRFVDSELLRNITLMDMPAAAPLSRIRAADIAIVVVSPQRYADVATWELVNSLDDLGVTVWLAMNRSRGRSDEVVEDLRTLTKDIGLDAPVFAITERNLVAPHEQDGGLLELAAALEDAAEGADDIAWESVVRRSEKLVAIAKGFVDETQVFLADRRRLQQAIVSGFGPVGERARATLESGELAARAQDDWKDVAGNVSERVVGELTDAAASVAAEWRHSEFGASLLEQHDGHELAHVPDSSRNYVHQQLMGWRDEVARGVRAKLKRNPRQAKVDELIDAVRITAVGGTVKVGWFAKRRLTTTVEELAKDARRRLGQTLAQLGDNDAARFVKQLGPGPSEDDLGQLAVATEQLENVVRPDHG